MRFASLFRCVSVLVLVVTSLCAIVGCSGGSGETAPPPEHHSQSGGSSAAWRPGDQRRSRLQRRNRLDHELNRSATLLPVGVEPNAGLGPTLRPA